MAKKLVPPGYLSKRQVVNLIGPAFWRRDEMVDAKDVDRWIDAGKFPPVAGRMGNQSYWLESDVRRWMQNPPADCRANFRVIGATIGDVKVIGGAA